MKTLFLGKKAEQGLTIKKLITILLVLLVILVVGISIFRPEIWEWIKNLPGYQQNPDRIIDVDAGDMKALEYWEVGRAKYYSSVKGYRISVTKTEAVNDNQKASDFMETDLYVKADSGGNGKITIDNSWFIDDNVGEVKQHYLIFDMEKYSSLKSGTEKKTEEKLIGLLQNSKYVSGSFWRLKSEQVKLWPESAGISNIDLPLSSIKKEGNYLKIDLSGYFKTDNNCEFVSIEKRTGQLANGGEIALMCADKITGEAKPIYYSGSIYGDGYIRISNPLIPLGKGTFKVNSDSSSCKAMIPLCQTNLKVNYAEVWRLLG